jgi:membrane-associated protein
MNPLDLLHWLTSDAGLMAVFAQNWLLGSCLIAAIIFVETGLVVMPFLPGDSLLFGAGAFLGVKGISPLPVIIIVALAAIAGDAVNYSIGRSRLGQALVKKGWVKPKHLDKTREYFDRYGGMTITIGRFVPIVRTIAPFLAGMTGMQPRRFFTYNIIGGIAWCAGLVLAGFWLGKITWVHEHLQWLSLVIVAVSLVPVAVQMLKERHIAKSAPTRPS